MPGRPLDVDERDHIAHRLSQEPDILWSEWATAGKVTRLLAPG